MGGQGEQRMEGGKASTEVCVGHHSTQPGSIVRSPSEEPWSQVQITFKKGEGSICSLAPVSHWSRVTLWDDFLTLPICHYVSAD